MTSHRTAAHALAGISALVLTVGFLSGCTPEPDPTPTPTAAFASEEEAFAAAEEVYRAYNDALNSIDPTDTSTFEPVFALSSGSFEKADRKNLSVMHAEGHKIDGASIILSFHGERSTPELDEVQAVVCLDVHEVKVTDAAGNSLVNPNRPDVYALNLTFVERDGGLLIDSAARIEDSTCAA